MKRKRYYAQLAAANIKDERKKYVNQRFSFLQLLRGGYRIKKWSKFYH